MAHRRILIDTDPGIDDSLAILLALASPEVQVEGISIVFGNCSSERGAENALAVLELAKASHIPVAVGCSRPLVQPLLLAPETHGDTGIGYAQLPPAITKPARLHAVDFIIDSVLASPGEITLVSIGPLTNLALAIRREPRLLDAIPEIISQKYNNIRLMFYFFRST